MRHRGCLVAVREVTNCARKVFSIHSQKKALICFQMFSEAFRKSIKADQLSSCQLSSRPN